jgi:hypothetical protein
MVAKWPLVAFAYAVVVIAIMMFLAPIGNTSSAGQRDRH